MSNGYLLHHREARAKTRDGWIPGQQEVEQEVEPLVYNSDRRV